MRIIFQRKIEKETTYFLQTLSYFTFILIPEFSFSICPTYSSFWVSFFSFFLPRTHHKRIYLVNSCPFSPPFDLPPHNFYMKFSSLSLNFFPSVRWPSQFLLPSACLRMKMRVCKIYNSAQQALFPSLLGVDFWVKNPPAETAKTEGFEDISKSPSSPQKSKSFQTRYIMVGKEFHSLTHLSKRALSAASKMY